MRSSIQTTLYPDTPFAIMVDYLPLEQFDQLTAEFDFKIIRNTDTGDDAMEHVFSATTLQGIYFRFDYFNAADRISFLVEPSGKMVHCSSTASPTSRSINSVLNGIIVKCCLQLQQRFCLHAGGIRVDEQLMLFVGHKGAGKSTLSAFFHVKGHAIWCDDYCVLEPDAAGFAGWRGECAVKVDKQLTSQLNISEEQLQSVFAVPDHWVEPGTSTDYGAKYYFRPLTAPADSSGKLPVTAIFFLKQRSNAGSEIVSEASSIEAMRILMNEIMLPGIVSKQYVSSYFKSLPVLLNSVRSYIVQAPDDLSRLDEVYSAILKTLN